MHDLLADEANLLLLQSLVSGEAVSVNLSSLSRTLGKHRNTIKKKVEAIFEHKILDRPVFKFPGLYQYYPLLIALNLDQPRMPPDRKKFEKWVKECPNIFAAFRSRQGDYDTLLFVYHQSITSYQLWMESLHSILRLKYGISEAAANFDSSTTYFSNQRVIKYDPSSGIHLIESDFQEKGELIINGYTLDIVDLEILKSLVSGKGIKANYSALCEKTGLHRKTVEKRISEFMKEGLLSTPVCRFPNYFVPPIYVLTYSLFEIRKSQEKVIREIVQDPHVPIGYKILHGKFNFLLFGNHHSIGDHLKWEEGYRKKFPDAIGSVNITYLSPRMTIAFDRQIVALSFIENKLKGLLGKRLRKTMEVPS
jgi:DNA-binding Lrp family transcriptional regulator